MTKESITIERPALGRVASIGDFYDAGRDVFIQSNLFNQSIPAECVTVQKAPSTSANFHFTNSTEEKLKIWNMDGDISLSFMCGMLKVFSGSATYLNEKRENSRTMHCVFSQSVQHQMESVNIAHKDLRDKVAPSGIATGATHVVVGIKKGCNAFVELTCQVDDENSESSAKGRMEPNFRNFSGSWKDYAKGLLGKSADPQEQQTSSTPDTLTTGRSECSNSVAKSGNGIGGGYKSTSTEKMTEIRLKIFADVHLEDGLTPLSLDEGQATIKAICRKAANGESTVPQVYVLLDVKEVARILDLKFERDFTFSPMSNSQVQKTKSILSEGEGQALRIKEFVSKVKEFRKFVPEEKLHSLQENVETCALEASKLQQSFADLLPKMRTCGDSEDGDEHLMEMGNIFAEFNHSLLAEKQMTKLLSENQDLLEFTEFLKKMKEMKVKLIEKYEEFLDIKRTTKKSYILFFSFESIFEANWERTRTRFLNLCGDPEGALCVAVSTDLVPKIATSQNVEKAPRIAILRNDAYATKDFVSDAENLEKCNIVSPKNKEDEPAEVDSLSLVSAKLPCPDPLCRHSSESIWYCSQCLKLLEFDLDQHFYCGCGRKSLDGFLFKCSSANHGNRSIPYPMKELKEHLAKLQSYKQINILLIGETGVGKSTWLNSLPSYISFATLDEAKKEPLQFLIPFHVAHNTAEKDGLKSTIHTFGSSSANEVQEFGKSSTVQPRSYYFKHEDTIYHVIDTPGVGDCDGPEVDKKNMQNIINYLCELDRIHLICFLMPPNQSRIHERFEFCFNELIMQFHRSAIGNIAFCVTKAMGVNFQVDDTARCLKELIERITKDRKEAEIQLNEDNLFIFDNMGYLHLAKSEKMDSIDASHIPSAEHSYSVSRNETLRMFNYASHSRPHKTEETKQTSWTRLVVQRLLGNVVVVAMKLGEMTQKITEKNEKVEQYKENEEELRKILWKKLDIPRDEYGYGTKRICKECLHDLTEESQRLYSFEYADILLATAAVGTLIFISKKFKLPDLNLPNVLPDFSKALAVPCDNCGEMGSRVAYYRNRRISAEIDDDVQEQLDTFEDERQEIEHRIEELRLLQSEMESEMSAISNALKAFISFLVENSIIAFNKRSKDYECHEVGADDNKELKEVKEMIKEVLAESSEQRMKVTVEEVMKLVEDLQKLKHYGQDIKEALEFVTSTSYQDIIRQGPVYDPKGNLPSMARLGAYIRKLIKPRIDEV